MSSMEMEDTTQVSQRVRRCDPLSDSSLGLRERVVSVLGLLNNTNEEEGIINDGRQVEVLGHSQRVEEQLSSVPQCLEEEDEAKEDDEESISQSLRLRQRVISAVLGLDDDDDEEEKEKDEKKGDVCKVSSLPPYVESTKEKKTAKQEDKALKMKESTKEKTAHEDNTALRIVMSTVGDNSLKKKMIPTGSSATDGVPTSVASRRPAAAATLITTQPGAYALTSTSSRLIRSFTHNMRSWSSRRLVTEEEDEDSADDTGLLRVSVSTTAIDDEDQQQHGSQQEEDEESPSTLAQARPVSEDENSPDSREFDCSSMEEAQPVVVFDQEDPSQQESKGGKTTTSLIYYSLAIVACLVLVSALAVGLTGSREDLDSVADDWETATVIGPPSRLLPLPPIMKNLELLYNDLPESTKESLSNKETPQYQAWEWLHNHPNITTYPEWRKKQIFAMGTFYYSLEGPNWPETSPAHNRWMDVKTSECDWVLSEAEVAYFEREAIKIVGPEYDEQDWQPCNKEGQLQTLWLHQLYFSTDVKPVVPPEIGLLTSLRIMGIIFSQLGGVKLSDLLVPELVRLPNLVAINLHSSGASGTIPKDIGLMTGLRHLLIGDNDLTGTLPSELLKMTSLEHFGISYSKEITGTLPSELGLMTSLTGLWMYRSSITGTIPSELGSLSLKVLGLDGNRLSGSVPSQLGLMSRLTWLDLASSGLTGSIPSQLGLLTNAVRFRLGNDLELFQDCHGNNFMGSLPKELFGLSNMERIFLPDLPYLTGTIPEEGIGMMANLTMLSLSGSTQLMGTLPEDICSIQELEFDCSRLLCGCDCECFYR